jgi:hypothetical protein
VPELNRDNITCRFLSSRFLSSRFFGGGFFSSWFLSGGFFGGRFFSSGLLANRFGRFSPTAAGSQEEHDDQQHTHKLYKILHIPSSL